MAFEEIKIRSFHKQRDLARVENLERRCEVGSQESSILLIDNLGDPLCRVKNSPQYTMMVAELGDDLVGIVRGSIKIVTDACDGPATVGYVLGLRVSPLHRRRGIGTKLVQALEVWFETNNVDYAYMATEKDNEASLKLFIDKLGFVKFRLLAILVNSVGHKLLPTSSSVMIMKINVEQAEYLYKTFMESIEFFPHDIGTVLRNKLSLGTWVAYPRGESWDEADQQVNMLPSSWAMLSVWNSGEAFKLKVGKALCSCAAYINILNLLHIAFPCLGVPAIPDVCSYFGFYFMYGLYGKGPKSGQLVQSLCKFVHNMAAGQCKDCKFIVTELSEGDAVSHYIPHWKFLSSYGDTWCIKALRSDKERSITSRLDWAKAHKKGILFVDPREV